MTSDPFGVEAEAALDGDALRIRVLVAPRHVLGHACRRSWRTSRCSRPCSCSRWSCRCGCRRSVRTAAGCDVELRCERGLEEDDRVVRVDQGWCRPPRRAGGGRGAAVDPVVRVRVDSGRAGGPPRSTRRRRPMARGRSPGASAPARCGSSPTTSTGNSVRRPGAPCRCTIRAASVSMTVSTVRRWPGCVGGGARRRRSPGAIGGVNRPAGSGPNGPRAEVRVTSPSCRRPGWWDPANARTIASTVKDASRLRVLVVHPALRVRHAVAARRSSGGGRASTGRRGRRGGSTARWR